MLRSVCCIQRDSCSCYDCDEDSPLPLTMEKQKTMFPCQWDLKSRLINRAWKKCHPVEGSRFSFWASTILFSLAQWTRDQARLPSTKLLKEQTKNCPGQAICERYVPHTSWNWIFILSFLRGPSRTLLMGYILEISLKV